MSDMKMSEVFDLPVSVDGFNLNDGYIGGVGGMTIANFDYEFVSTLSTSMAEHSAHAINNHDELVEVENKLLSVLCDIQGMCIGDIAMGYKLDPESIGTMIYEATGMTHPELSEKLTKQK